MWFECVSTNFTSSDSLEDFGYFIILNLTNNAIWHQIWKNCVQFLDEKCLYEWFAWKIEAFSAFPKRCLCANLWKLVILPSMPGQTQCRLKISNFSSHLELLSTSYLSKSKHNDMIDQIRKNKLWTLDIYAKKGFLFIVTSLKCIYKSFSWEYEMLKDWINLNLLPPDGKFNILSQYSAPVCLRFPCRYPPLQSCSRLITKDKDKKISYNMTVLCVC